MGTKSITLVKLKNQIKITQPHWNDGYPAKDGISILDFLTKDLKRDKFIERLQTISYAADEKTLLKIEQEQENFKGTKILKYVQEHKNSIVFNALEDGIVPDVFDYGYLIDLDNNNFEIYALYKSSLKNRNAKKDSAFKNYNLLRKYDLNNLPSNEEILNTFDIC